MRDVLQEFPPVVVAGVEIVVDQDRPVAAIAVPDGTVRFATWPDLAVGPVEPRPTLVPGPDGAWMHYPPSTVALMDDSHDALLDTRDSPAVLIRPDGSVSVVATGDRRAIGASAGVLWTAPEAAQRVDDGYRGGPLPEGWEEPTLLTLVHADGTVRELASDRHVYCVFEEDGLVHVLVAPTPPVAVPDDGAIRYEYRVSEVVLPTELPFPASLRFRDHHPRGIGPRVEPRRCWWTAHDWSLPPSPPERFDLADVAGTRWHRAALTAQQIDDATEAASHWFGDPNAFWHGQDGGVGPLAARMRDAEVHLEDPWPDTRVVVTFRHPHWPEGRLRRAVRVFDEAGRVTSNPYVDIELMEDLDTGDLPPADRARDGVLDV